MHLDLSFLSPGGPVFSASFPPSALLSWLMRGGKKSFVIALSPHRVRVKRKGKKTSRRSVLKEARPTTFVEGGRLSHTFAKKEKSKHYWGEREKGREKAKNENMFDLASAEKRIVESSATTTPPSWEECVVFSGPHWRWRRCRHSLHLE